MSSEYGNASQRLVLGTRSTHCIFLYSPFFMVALWGRISWGARPNSPLFDFGSWGGGWGGWKRWGLIRHWCLSSWLPVEVCLSGALERGRFYALILQAQDPAWRCCHGTELCCPCCSWPWTGRKRSRKSSPRAVGTEDMGISIAWHTRHLRKEERRHMGW